MVLFLNVRMCSSIMRLLTGASAGDWRPSVPADTPVTGYPIFYCAWQKVAENHHSSIKAGQHLY
eukprot:scaffold4879_cov71-Cyclotella_meneghiniana.AAC.11